VDVSNEMKIESASASMQFKRDDDAFCTHAVLGKYLGNLALNFQSGRKTVMVFHRSNSDIVLLDKPVKGVECVMGDSLANVVQNDLNRKRIEKFLAKLDLTIVGNKAVYTEDENEDEE